MSSYVGYGSDEHTRLLLGYIDELTVRAEKAEKLLLQLSDGQTNGDYFSYYELAQEYANTWDELAKVKANLPVIVEELQARIAELEAAQRWVPVSERLPDKIEIVDVLIETSYGLSQQSDTFLEGEWVYWGQYTTVTHWKYRTPLPAYYTLPTEA